MKSWNCLFQTEIQTLGAAGKTKQHPSREYVHSAISWVLFKILLLEYAKNYEILLKSKKLYSTKWFFKYNNQVVSQLLKMTIVI